MKPTGASSSLDTRYGLAPWPARDTGSVPNPTLLTHRGQSNPELEDPKRFDPDIRRLLTAGRQAEASFDARRKHRRTRGACWLVLGLLALLPAALVTLMPERVVSTIPATAALYGAFGQTVNVYGIEIRSVDVQNLLLDGHRVISVKGEIVNIAETQRKIPWLRFGLRSADGREVYNWKLDTAARPLRSGETRHFTTRLASPPETAARIEIRFAHAHEIGSNDQP